MIQINIHFARVSVKIPFQTWRHGHLKIIWIQLKWHKYFGRQTSLSNRGQIGQVSVRKVIRRRIVEQILRQTIGGHRIYTREQIELIVVHLVV